jgi:HK97 family phage major capsid protein
MLPALRRIERMANPESLLKALNENTNTQGGYLVPEIWASKIYDLIVAKSTAIQLCEQVTMTSDTLYFPKVTAASTAYFTDEAGTITASQPTFGQLVLHPKKVAALSRLSSEVMEDSNPSIMNIVTQRLAEDIALKIDYEIYNGTTSTGGFNGMRDTTADTAILTYAVGGEISTDALSNAIEKMQSQNIEPTDLVIHPKLLNKLRKLKTSTTSNEPLLNMTTFGSAPLGNGVVGKIWGINVILTTQLPTDLTGGTATTASEAVLVSRGRCGIFANRRQLNLNKFYLIDTDDWKIQSNLRCAFAVNYSKAICVLQDIQCE